MTHTQWMWARGVYAGLAIAVAVWAVWYFGWLVLVPMLIWGARVEQL